MADPIRTPAPPTADGAGTDPITDLVRRTMTELGGTGATGDRGAGADGGAEPAGLTLQEQQALIAQLSGNWLIDPGAPGIAGYSVEIRIDVDPDRKVREARVLDRHVPRMRRDPAFRAFAESAWRAVLKSSPLALPPAKYESWKQITVTFSPEDMFER